jgi:hypothetical protein
MDRIILTRNKASTIRPPIHHQVCRWPMLTIKDIPISLLPVRLSTAMMVQEDSKVDTEAITEHYSGDHELYIVLFDTCNEISLNTKFALKDSTILSRRTMW